MRHAIDGVGLALVIWGVLWAAVGVMPLAFALLGGTIGSYAVYDASNGGQGAKEAAVVFLGSSVITIAVGVVIAGIGLVSALTGVGVRQRRPIARWLAVMIGAVSLPACPPFGLVFGFYVLYVMLDGEVGAAFDTGLEQEF